MVSKIIQVLMNLIDANQLSVIIEFSCSLPYQNTAANPKWEHDSNSDLQSRAIILEVE